MKNLYINPRQINASLEKLATTYSGSLTKQDNSLRLQLDSPILSGNISIDYLKNGLFFTSVYLTTTEDFQISIESLNTLTLAYNNSSKIAYSDGIVGSRETLKSNYSLLRNKKKTINTILHLAKNTTYNLNFLHFNNAATYPENSFLKQFISQFSLRKKGVQKHQKQTPTVIALLAKLNNNSLKKEEIINAILNEELNNHSDGFDKLAQAFSHFKNTQLIVFKNSISGLKNHVLENILSKTFLEKHVQ